VPRSVEPRRAAPRYAAPRRTESRRAALRRAAPRRRDTEHWVHPRAPPPPPLPPPLPPPPWYSRRQKDDETAPRERARAGKREPDLFRPVRSADRKSKRDRAGMPTRYRRSNVN